ncbi:hypothetical protein ACGFOU_28165 [Streptomyces sp. NPDC048595]|uniref:hypothetical protein n=1 Tax=Streptomyces sp. NPDC048595 TaxID=3365576 RepID=UPI003711546B
MLETLWAALLDAGRIVLALVLLVVVLTLVLIALVLAWNAAGKALQRIAPETRQRIRALPRTRVRNLTNRLRDRALRMHSRTVVLAVRRYAQWSARGATRHLSWAREGFGQDAPRLFPPSHAVRSAIFGWYASMPLAGIAYAVKACVLLLITVNTGTIVTTLATGTAHLWDKSGKADVSWRAPGGSPTHHVAEGAGSDPLAPLPALMAALRSAGGAVAGKAGPYLSALTDPLGRPLEAITAAAALVLAAMVLLASRVVWVALREISKPAYRGLGPVHSDPSPRFARIGSLLSLRVETNRENRPVVVLVNCLARVGAAQAHHRWSVGHRNPHSAPRVQLADAEGVVWSAWRTRHTAIRGVLRARHKEHAAQVVGALRMLETRQDGAADRTQVFDDMARTLSKIAERYAQGRTLALLDPEDLADAPSAVNREWVRLVILGTVVIGSAVGASALGVSDAAMAQVVGIVSVVMVGLLYGARLAPTDLLDVVRGQSRK